MPKTNPHTTQVTLRWQGSFWVSGADALSSSPLVLPGRFLGRVAGLASGPYAALAHFRTFAFKLRGSRVGVRATRRVGGEASNLTRGLPLLHHA